ncbi:hypothetical protein F4774DRAFT_395527 [Daldinia eschscholtzii]|nr:hypothetical protein F4774DRAFT_395527 [Daldinia eschscholtzii]
MIDALIFDIIGDLSFGKSFNIKEPGANPFKTIPHGIVEYVCFCYPICRSPFLSLFLWLKPWGLDKLLEFASPSAVREYHRFIYQSFRVVLTSEPALTRACVSRLLFQASTHARSLPAA